MTDQPTQEFEALIDGYLDGTLTDEQQAQLFAALETDRAMLKRFAELTEMDAICREHAGQQLEAELVQSQVLPFDPVGLSPMQVDSNALTKDQYLGALGYVLRHTFTPKRLAILATAAALLLGTVITIVVLTGPEDSDSIAISPDMPAASTQSTPGGSASTTTPIVATLTAQRDAVWKQPGGDARPGALRQGTQLSAGQRLELTQGFAEITTNDGAIAILEAPATIELLDNANAIRLHAGKLMGICETEPSKGFLVRTPHLDITDLGTRFGVDSSSQSTEVHVFDGEVEAAQPAGDDLPTISRRLSQGDAIRSTAGGEGFVVIKSNQAHFASIHTFDPWRPNAASAETGIAALSGDIHWSPFANYTERKSWPSENRAVVFEELSRYQLIDEAPVSLIAPGSMVGTGVSVPNRAIPAGTTVRTYIVMLYSGRQGEIARPHGAITFEGEVIGIATNETQAKNFSRSVGEGAQLAPIKLEKFHWMDAEDSVALTEDRRTVRFAYRAGADTTDAVRVFVRIHGD